MIENIEDNYKFDFVVGKWSLESSSKLLIKELADFYSSHYGVWSKNAPYSQGKQVRLSSDKLVEWLDNEMSELWTVRYKEKLVGYAIVLRGKSGSKEKVIWVTQFVIHTNYRNKGIGKHLLFRIWGFSSFFAWGLLTANPYAVRALEKATRRRCDPSRIKRNAQQLFNFGVNNVSYVKSNTVKETSDNTSKIQTDFFVDHSDIGSMMANISSVEKPWLLGQLDEGWEWFAFTFSDQHPIELTSEEVEAMLNASDKIARDAYARMPMDATSHKWASHSENEVEYTIRECDISVNDRILDVGCGMGRHSLELSRKGFDVTGIDYAKELIGIAKKKASNESLNAKFIVSDIIDSEIFPINSFDCILCLYDVIGSYADNSKNRRIITQISSLLKKGGKAIISVMNLELTEHIVKYRFNIKESSAELLTLPASHTMENSGNVFNPEFLLIDEETKVIYRKEVFSFGAKYPTELIVRDRRFYMSDIVKMCEDENLKVTQKRFVNAGWQKDYENTDRKAKEILLICEKI